MIQHNSFFMKHARGTVVQGAPSLADPCGEDLFVICAKHPHAVIAVKFDVTAVNIQYVMGRAIDEAFERCEGCQHEAEHAASRWPPGAEL